MIYHCLHKVSSAASHDLREWKVIKVNYGIIHNKPKKLENIHGIPITESPVQVEIC